MRHGHAEVGIHHARLYRRSLIFRVDLQDMIHPRKRRDDSALSGQCSSGKTGSGASPDERDFVPIGEPHNLNYVRRRTREHDALRPRHFDRAIVLVK